MEFHSEVEKDAETLVAQQKKESRWDPIHVTEDWTASHLVQSGRGKVGGKLEENKSLQRSFHTKNSN